MLGPILIIIKHQINSANQALMIWNNLPDNIQHCKSLALLRSTLSKTCAHTCIHVCVHVWVDVWMDEYMLSCICMYVHIIFVVCLYL